MTMEHDHAGHPAPTAEGHEPGHETRDANTRAIVTFAVVLTVLLVVVHLGLLGLYRLMLRHRPPEPTVNAPVNIYEQLQRMRQSEQETLTTYGWVDRNAGVVRIPIERAMELVARRGVPRGKGPRTEAEVNSHHGTPAKAEGKAEDKEKKP
jgi:hypothetical protein